jgi:hypothetical protein
MLCGIAERLALLQERLRRYEREVAQVARQDEQTKG